jgi:hypothetical protein
MDKHDIRPFHVFAAVAVAGFGRLPESLVDRSILIRMSRRTANEKIEPFDRRASESLVELRRRCARWAADHLAVLRSARPTVPEGLNDRQVDGWIPLLAIAEAIGGKCAETARKVAVALSTGVAEDAESWGELLLSDIRDVFFRRGLTRISTEDLLEALVALEGRPWAEAAGGRPLTSTRLAALLKPFGVRPNSVRIGGSTPKGYKLEAFADAFRRYLPAAEGTVAPAATAATSAARRVKKDGSKHA